jgi:hypothetical protein
MALMPRNFDLIVPIRDRRQRKRYVTLKNFGIAAIVAALLFIGITIRSEMRGTGAANYGGIVEREMPQVEQKPVEVVREAQVVDTEQTHADPLLIRPAAREQWLHADTPDPAPVAIPHRAATAMATGETDVVVVGGPEGVKVVQKERRRPVLSGGFGRQ